MARTRSISDRQILDAARRVFLDKGYSATTAEIARAADISEGTIFRRFGSKDELFRHALGIGGELEWFELADQLVGEGDVRENLRRLTDAIHEFFATVIPRMIGVISSPIEACHAFSTTSEPPPPVRVFQRVSGYLQSEIELGRLPDADNVEIVTRVLLGTVHQYTFFEIVGINDALHADADEDVDVLDGVVDVVMDALESSARKRAAGGESE